METLEREMALVPGMDSDDQTRVGTGIYTTMKYLMVDGIESHKPLERQHRTDEFYKIKDEFDDEGFVSDTGGQGYRHPGGDAEMSETHWLAHGALIQIGEYCYKCGKKAED